MTYNCRIARVKLPKRVPRERGYFCGFPASMMGGFTAYYRHTDDTHHVYEVQDYCMPMEGGIWLPEDSKKWFDV